MHTSVSHVESCTGTGEGLSSHFDRRIKAKRKKRNDRCHMVSYLLIEDHDSLSRRCSSFVFCFNAGFTHCFPRSREQGLPAHSLVMRTQTGEAARKRFRKDTLELFLDNAVSAERLGRHAEAAMAAGAEGIADVVAKATSQKPARALTRLCKKGSRWPPPYCARLPSRTMACSETKMSNVEMLLPHEILFQLTEFADMSEIVAEQCRIVESRPDIQCFLAQHGLQEEPVILFSLWEDGVPFNRNREHTLEVWSLCLVGLPGENFPLSAWPKELQVKRVTHNSMFDVLAWSFRALFSGTMPTARHDGQAWTNQDGFRRKNAGKSLRFRGFLVELRGDWSMLKSVLHLQGWNESSGICFKCRATKADLVRIEEDAAWRRDRFSQEEFLARQEELEKSLSHFWRIPWTTVETIKIDWLHTCDHGTSADWLANVIWLIVENKMEGRSQLQRCDFFFTQVIQPFYKEHSVQSKMPFLRPSMLKKEKSGCFKLRSKAGECRALIGIIPTLLERFFAEGEDEVQDWIIQGSRALYDTYQCLSADVWNLGRD